MKTTDDDPLKEGGREIRSAGLQRLLTRSVVDRRLRLRLRLRAKVDGLGKDFVLEKTSPSRALPLGAKNTLLASPGSRETLPGH
ncbi:hypothetical protein [Cryobacterium sp. Y82]|uniref:hypothetical protein n=1 Tax=Cryobacterium sp. Y82 TaxID=2045017 RepID=UPI001304C858|nr:hypothetical protein [Cryobacterium sp. Y82]